jgi:hypothetical protein
MPPRGRGRGRGGHGRGRGEPAPEDPPANLDLAAILAEMQTMRAEMNGLRQAPVGGANMVVLLVLLVVLPVMPLVLILMERR